ncbi:DUF1648 domain-containing protein [Paenisporosarcina antarctica]|uniref:DUF1648 domain-containing protein n=1 Tax=Paenisporosarcina antarctica TaxID=417367 RepID=A0A4P6ZU92_9BACL|nr:DUF5808 domain-containing protein [Paenisporosarcina antarctica]QBP39654.1 DUF1648 domain-containing protein [Paenisporosarcina antarctica]
MAAVMFMVILIFIIVIQAFLPKFLKDSEAFGIYIPDTHVKDKRLEQMKNRYTQLVLTSGIVILAIFIGWLWVFRPAEEPIVLAGMAAQLVALIFSMGLYAKNHIALANFKKDEKWTEGQSERKVVDLQFREQLKLLPNVYFVLPMLITLGLGILGLSQYDTLPNQIPTHWGPSGEADAFAEKTWISISALPFMTLILQGMMLFFNGAMKQSGAKIQVRHKKRSREQQLAFRKYSSWLLFVIAIAITLLMGYLQLTIIYPETMSSSVTLGFTLGFLVIILGSVLYYTVKVGQSGTRIAVLEQDVNSQDVIDTDDDQYWKFGLIYVNKNDPSILVEKRFGIGWTVNMGHKGSWIFLVLLFGSIFLIATLL